MPESALTIVIVGGVAGGASAATRARRVNESAEIILFEKDEYVSFANCGLPYYVGGEIEDRDKLLVATADFLANRFKLDVRTRQEVQSIDRAAKTVTVLNRTTAATYTQPYDRLILAPGADPLVPPMEGADAEGVFTLRNMADVDRMKAAAEASTTKKAVVVGAGYIGIEMVEQLIRCGFQTTLVELKSQILPLFDPEMVRPLQDDLTAHDVPLHLGDGIARVTTDESGRATGVELASGKHIDGDLVILGIGVRPNLKLARAAGLAIGPGGGIATNRFMQTDDPNIYAVGDAAEYVYGPTGKPLRIALAGPANRAGRLAGEHAATGKASPMADVLGTSIVRVFDGVAAMTGLTSGLATAVGQAARSVTVIVANHAGYYPGATPITLKLLYEPESGQILGAQAVGKEGVDKRIDVIATAMAMRATVRDLAGLDLAYAPPFGSAKDPVHMAAFAACNQLDGLDDVVDADIDLAGKQVVDVRKPEEIAEAPLAGATSVVAIPLDELRDRIGELDKTADTVVTCAAGLRGHVALRILRQHGFEKVANLSGGATVRNRAVGSHE
jgi:NADPH-dependent 2,4-dienoyl-CoA reductase/sulfur reductase-like enzyme/rhodanese-related sulfurtransferase